MSVRDLVSSAVAVTPSDSANLTKSPASGLFVGAAGNVKLALMDDSDANAVTIAVQAGQSLPWRVRKVFATGTTATGLVALYERY